MKRNHFLQVITVLLLLIWSVVVKAAPVERTEAKAWAEQNGKLLLDTFREPDLQKRYNKLDEIMVEFVDLDYVSKFVLGKYWRQMSPAQQAQYRGIFKRHALAMYKGFPLDFAHSITYQVGEVLQDKEYTVVTATVNVKLDAKSPPQSFLLQFRLHQVGGKIQLVDIKLAESSLILSFRSKFYEQIAALDGEIEWFLEDLELQTAAMEQNNQKKLGF